MQPLRGAQSHPTQRLKSDDLGHRSPGAGQDHFLARLRRLNQRRQRGLGLLDVHLAHRRLRSAGWSDQPTLCRWVRQGILSL